MAFDTYNTAHLAELIRSINNRPDSPEADFSVLGGTHGEEKLPLRVLWLLRHNPQFRLRVAYPGAVRLGVRTLGDTKQLMAHYDVTRHTAGDQKDQVAAANLAWLGPQCNNPNKIVFDLHNSLTPGSKYQLVGQRALAAAIAAGFLLGYDRCAVSRGTFFRAVHNGAALETPMVIPEEEVPMAEELARNMIGLPSIGIDGLHKLYPIIHDWIKFYRMHEIPTTNPDGTLADYLPALEAVRPDTAFTPIDLSDDFRARFGIVGPAVTGSWSYNHFSPLRPDLGVTQEGEIRREHIGQIAERIDPPQLDGQWVQFA